MTPDSDSPAAAAAGMTDHQIAEISPDGQPAPAPAGTAAAGSSLQGQQQQQVASKGSGAARVRQAMLCEKPAAQQAQ